MNRFATFALAVSLGAIVATSAACSAEAEPAHTATPSITTTQESTISIADLPYEVQVYASIGRDLLQSGQVDTSTATWQYVQSDVRSNYGIKLTEEQAKRVLASILDDSQP